MLNAGGDIVQDYKLVMASSSEFELLNFPSSNALHDSFIFSIFMFYYIAVYFNFCKSKITSNSVHTNSDGAGTRINSYFQKSSKTIVSTFEPIFFGQKFRPMIIRFQIVLVLVPSL